MTPTRLAELESLKLRLRHIVFNDDGPRGEKAARVLRLIHARLDETATPAHEAKDAAACAAKKSLANYLAVAMSTCGPLGTEAEATARVTTLCGGVERGFRLLRLSEEVRSGLSAESVRRVRDNALFKRQLTERVALKARSEGFSAEAVRAFLAISAR